MEWWRIIHMLSLVWLGAGLGATYPLVLRAWASKDVKFQMYCLVEAANNEARVLIPGAMATGITGFFWAVSRDYNFVREGWLAALTGLLVLVPTWLALVQLRNLGPSLLLLLMSVAWISDSAAYFAGRRFGRHKLAPSISPGKTWEGVAGAVLAVSLAASDAARTGLIR